MEKFTGRADIASSVELSEKIAKVEEKRPRRRGLTRKVYIEAVEIQRANEGKGDKQT